MRELYVRYDRQLQRWKDYRNLVAFLAFVGLFLATLFLQRQAVDAYKVYNTIATTVLPDGGETQVMQEKGQVSGEAQARTGEREGDRERETTAAEREGGAGGVVGREAMIRRTTVLLSCGMEALITENRNCTPRRR